MPESLVLWSHMDSYRRLIYPASVIVVGAALLYALGVGLSTLTGTAWMRWLYGVVDLPVMKPNGYPLPLWSYALAGVAALPMGWRLLTHYGLVDKRQATLSLVIVPLWLFLLSYGTPWYYGLATVVVLLCLMLQVGGYQTENRPILFFLQGLLIGVGALVEPILIYAVVLVLCSQHWMKSFSVRHVLAGLLGTCLPLLYASTYWLYQGGINAVSDELLQWGREVVRLDLPRVSGQWIRLIPYAVTLIVGLALALIVFSGESRVGVFDRACNALYSRWMLAMLCFGVCSGGATSPYTTLAIVPLCILLGRIVAGLPAREQRVALLGIAGGLLLLLLIPQYT